MTLGNPATGVIVTGGASGIGKACVEALAQVGRKAAVWDLGADHQVGDVQLAVDVTDASSFSDAIAASRDAIGPIGGLVHAAGVVRTESVEDIDADGWDAVLDVNLRAEALLVKALLPELRATAPGSAVVGIASIEAIVGHAAIPAYCSSKAGLLGLTRSLALHLAPQGIRVNAVCPGFVETPMLAPALAIDEFRNGLVSQIPIGRLAQPDDIGRVVRFLLSEEASYITGAEIVVDGGFTKA